jgi:hypothetical protein
MFQIYGNMGRVNLLIEEILNQNLIENYLERIYPYNSESLIEDKILKVLTMFFDLKRSNSKIDVFKFKLIEEANKKLQDKLKSELSTSSVLYLSKLMQSPSLGTHRINIWLAWAFENFPARNLSKNFDSSLEKVKPKDLHNLKYYYVLSPDYREIASSKINELKESKSTFYKSIYYEIMENELWNNLFSEKLPGFSINLIKEKRKYYQDLVGKGLGGEYVIFKLFEMGDIQREYFIYLLAIKSYGIQSTQILPL